MSENKKNYINFEHYCINKHNIDFNQTTYHWSVIPDTVLIESGYFKSEYELRMKRKNNNQILKEYGLDGISIEDNKIYHGLQMKLWNNTICANDLGTFISVIFNRFSDESKGYLYHTSKLEKILKGDINNRNKIIEIKIDNPFNNELNINKPFINNEVLDIKLRPYQVEAIQKLNENWDGIKSLILPCGTGKTTIFNEYLKQNNFKNIFIFSPLTMLTEQNLDNIKKYIPNYNHILVDCNGTRDINIINKNLNEYTIFSSTFKSAEEVISKIFEENNILLGDSILIVDEAHNLLNLNNLIKTVKSFNKVLLVTATPPSDMEEIIPNSIIYKYSFTDAIKDGYICDYVIYLPYIENNKVIISQPLELIDLDENICKKCLFLVNGLLRTGSRRTIVYLKSKEECEIYSYVLNYIMTNYHYYKVNISKITSDTNKKDRVDILSYFEENSIEEELKIILSIRILDEGINLIKCDSVYLTNLGDSSNDIRTIQRILRANRKDPSNPNKKASIFIWCEDTDLSLDVFQMLKNNDVEFNKKIKVIDNNYDTYYKDNIGVSNINKYNIDNELIQNINIKCLTHEELWELKKNLLFEYCDINNIIINENIIYKNQKIGNWYKSQKLKIKNNLSDNISTYNELVKNIYVKDDLDNVIGKNILKNVEENIVNNNNINELKSYYECKRCFYTCYQKVTIYKHLYKKFKCERKLESYNYDEKDLINLSLIRIKNSNNNNKTCEICNKSFSKFSSLKRHNDTVCNIEKYNKNKVNIINDFDNENENENEKNMIEIYNIIKSFDDKWDINHIDENKKLILLLNNHKFPATLENILENEVNLNVLIDNTTENGLIYNNNKIIKINIKEIVQKTLDKLLITLVDFRNDISYINPNNIDVDILDQQIELVKQQYKDFQKNNSTQNNIITIIKNIYSKKNNITFKSFKKIDY